MTPEQKELVQTSFEKVKPIADRAAALFYRRLFDLDPKLERLFKGDLEGQGRKLMHMIGLAVKGLNRPAEILPLLHELGERHAGYGVGEHDYETVGAALHWTLKQGLGDAFTPKVSEAWAAVYELLSNSMKAGAQAALWSTAASPGCKATTCTGGDRKSWREYFPTAGNKTSKKRETEMQTEDKHETLLGRFNTTIATIVMLMPFLFLIGTTISAKTITVTGTGDSIALDGTVTLREAICAANTNAVCGDAPKGDPGADTINFNIAGSGVRTITVFGALPEITEALTIDGYTQRPCTNNPAPCSKPNTLLNGSDAVLLIELNGTNTSGFVNGLTISAGTTKVRGLVINRFAADGIRIFGGSNHVIEGNFISTDPTGTVALPNKTTGIYVNGAPNSLIGGNTPAARNLVSGNSVLPIGAAAIQIDGHPNVPLTGTMIQGNFIGTNAAGTTALTNVGAGIILAYTSNTTIGGTAAGARNIISGSLYGIEIIPGGGTVIQGNYIGTDVTGTVNLGNKELGISIAGLSINNLIGGAVAGAGNVISGNGSSGIELNGTQVSGTLIQGNLIGVDASGTKQIANSDAGVSVVISASNTIGGTLPAARNIISGNASYGVMFSSGANNNQVQGNFIGTAVDGISPIGNASGVGILNASNTNTIGGTVSGTGNLIAFNLGNGVLVNQSNAAINNSILGNAMFSNAQLGISLKGGDFPINNDLNDTDPGPNNQQNYPVLTSAVSAGGSTAIQGTLNSEANKSYRIEFFANTNCNAAPPKDYGEGRSFLGFSTVTTSGNDVSFNVSFPVAVPPGQFITTTATDPTGNTSEFSRCTQVTAPVPPAGSLAFSSAIYSAVENAGGAVVTVKRAGGSAGAVSVQYATVAGGTATAGSDYNTTGGTLNWADGDAADKTFTVAVTDDSLNEANETVNLSLSNPGGGASLGNQSSAVLTIADNDAQPAISISDVSQAEGNSSTTNFSFDVTLSTASGQTVTIDYLTADGTALAGADYQTASGTLTFAPGETTKSFSVAVSGDTQDEQTETFVVNLSNPANATIARSQGVGTVVNDDAAAGPTIQFSQATYVTSEQLGAMTVTVTRSGDATGAASVDYATADGSAAQKGDYEYAAGTLNFGPGEVSKTFVVLLNQDSYSEGPEGFSLNLSNPAGAALGAQAVALVEITDDLTETAANPVDDAQTFVYMHYHDFLNREPDPAGLTFWTNQFTSCGNDATCIEAKRINVSAAFFLSIEFQETGYLRYLLQKESFGSTPKYAEFMRDVQEISRGVIVTAPGWEQKLKENQQQFAEKWVNRPAFKAAYDPMSNPDYVNAIYANAGILPTSTERDSLVNALESASESRAAILLDVAENAAFRQREDSAAFVLMQYFGYLRRDPDAAPDSDLSGYNFWLNKLNQFGGNYLDAEMIKSFITSIEYRQRFAQ